MTRRILVLTLAAAAAIVIAVALRGGAGKEAAPAPSGGGGAAEVQGAGKAGEEAGAKEADAHSVADWLRWILQNPIYAGYTTLNDVSCGSGGGGG